MVCNCKQVSYADIANAMEAQKDFGSVLELISEIMMGK